MEKGTNSETSTFQFTDTTMDKLIAKAEKLTKLCLTRWSADWKTATGLYEQAANTGQRKIMRKPNMHLRRLPKGRRCSALGCCKTHGICGNSCKGSMQME